MLKFFLRFYYSVVRWPRSHGFGVQSPFAYRFIKDVIRVPWPYYAYASLAKKYPNVSSNRLRLLRFYLRLSNYLQAKVWVENNLKAEDYDYINAGCRRSVVYSSNLSPDVAILDIVDDDCAHYENLLESLLIKMSEKSVLVIENIHCDRLAKRLWLKLISDSRVGVTFDLYDCGLAFFNLNMYKTNYKVMLKL